MRGSYTRLLAAKAILVYCVATAVGVLTGAYFIPAGALDRQSKLGGKQITSSTGFGIVQDDVDAQCSRPFILGITVVLKPEVRQHWLDQWAILAQHVFDNEPSLMAYELLEVEGKENTFFVYERYCNKSHLHDIHQQSKVFKDFKGWCAENEPYVVKAGQGAFPTGLGHWMRVQKGTIQ